MPIAERTDYLGSLLQGREAVTDAGGAWQQSLRMRAVERANELTVPTTRDEEWRFTDLSPIYKFAFRPSLRAGVVEQSQVDAYAVPEAQTRLVFVDGRWSSDLSRITPQDGVSIGNLRTISGSTEGIAKAHLGQHALIQQDAFAAVNTAFLHDGAMIHLVPDCVANAPIHLLFIATQKEAAAYPRVLVVAEHGAQCTVVEDFVGVTDGAYLTDAVSEFYVAEKARVSHVKLQREGQAGFHIANTSVRVAREGYYGTWAITLGARISRHNLSIRQDGEATEFSIDGLALIGGRQLADMHSNIDHAHAQGRSRQLHKTVVGDGAHAVFNGKILVRQGAQQTDSGQQSRNLLLSDKAHVDAKPQLEIFADDVKCAHGATVGQLEADELFYLKSRGLSDTAARNLLTYAFAAQVIERIPVKSVVDQLEKTVLEQTQTRKVA
ncbi:MAG: Fe-S cluster assembly protein SufD [Betaproteobacteria bacterium]